MGDFWIMLRFLFCISQWTYIYHHHIALVAVACFLCKILKLKTFKSYYFPYDWVEVLKKVPHISPSVLTISLVVLRGCGWLLLWVAVSFYIYLEWVFYSIFLAHSIRRGCRDRPTNVNRSDYISPKRNNIRGQPEMMMPFFDSNRPLKLRRGKINIYQHLQNTSDRNNSIKMEVILFASLYRAKEILIFCIHFL